MLLCLPLFLGFATEAQAQAECVSNDLLAHVDARMQVASVDRWQRIKNALTEQPNPIALSEVKAIYQNRLSHGWNTNRLEDVITAMECLAKPKPGALEADDAPQSCVSPELQANVKRYSEETWHGSAHVERWLRVLQTFSGTANDSTVMTPAEAQEMANKYSANRWNPVVVALQCLETESLNAQIEVQEPESELDDTPLPLQAEETPMPQQADPIDTTSLRVYFFGGTREGQSGEWTISEDDHWESELIIHYVSNQASPELTDNLCINVDIWGGSDHWNNGPITLPGFNDYADITDPALSAHGLYSGRWRCTGPVEDSPYVQVLQDDENGIEFLYRATVRTRDNNILENDFSIADDLEFRFSSLSKSVSSSKSKFNPELYTQGNANNMENVDDDDVGKPKIPPTPSDTNAYLDNTELPVIQDDEVSWIKLHKMNGKWIVSVYKPVMVTDGKDCSADEARQQAELDQLIADEPDGRLHNGIRNTFTWSFDNDCDKWWKTDQGLVLTIFTRRVVNGNTSSADVELLIPATNGIVQDIDYNLHVLKTVRSDGDPPNKRNNPSATVGEIGPFSELCEGQFMTIPLQYRGASVEASEIPTSMFPIDEPPDGTNLCQ